MRYSVFNKTQNFIPKKKSEKKNLNFNHDLKLFAIEIKI